MKRKELTSRIRRFRGPITVKLVHQDCIIFVEANKGSLLRELTRMIRPNDEAGFNLTYAGVCCFLNPVLD